MDTTVRDLENRTKYVFIIQWIDDEDLLRKAVKYNERDANNHLQSLLDDGFSALITKEKKK